MSKDTAINIEHVERLNKLLTWIRDETGLASSLDITIWQHRTPSGLAIDYRLWVSDLINQSCQSSAALIALIPYIKSVCTTHAILKNDKKLEKVA